MSCSRTIQLRTVLAGVAGASACRGGDSGGPTAPPTVDPPRATTVIVSPATAELDGAGAVATVDASGLVTGLAAGTMTITAGSGSAQGIAA